MKKLGAVVLLLYVAGYSYGQKVDKLIKEKDVTRIIKTLSADDMQGRGTFTPGIEKAAQFIEGEFKSIGLKPLAGATGFRQNVAITRVTPTSTKAYINGKAVNADSVVTYAASASFNWSNSTQDVQVATIGESGDFRTEYRKYMQSDKKMLILVAPKFAANFRSLKARLDQGSLTAEPGNRALVFVLTNVTDIKTFNVQYNGKVEQPTLFNVAGMLPGKTRPDEYAIFSAHYDHLGIVKPMEGDTIANGADDDASGTTAVITLAKYFKKLNNNARTIIFVAFTAEELGGYGSQYFAKMVNPDKTVAMFNIEMIGKASKFGENSAFITGFERSDFGPILQKNLEGTTFRFYPDPYPAQDLFYRSDNASLAKLGVPAHTISTDQIDIDKLYHTVKDEFSSLDVKNITSTIKAIALSSRGIVAGTETPTRVAKQ